MSSLVPTTNAKVRFALILLVFLLLGPFVGTVTVVAIFAPWTTGHTGSLMGELRNLLELVRSMHAFLAPLGLVSALITGATIGARQAFSGPVSLRFAGVTGLAVGLLVASPYLFAKDPIFFTNVWVPPSMAAASLAGTLVCWRCAKWLGPPKAAAPSAKAP